jgi:hypothetical protein
MIILSRCALIAAITAVSIAPPAFAQSMPTLYDRGEAWIDGSGYYGAYGVAPGTDYRWYAPTLTGGGSLGHNIMIHIY